MKKFTFFTFLLFYLCFLNAQQITKILPPDGYGLDDQEMISHYFLSENDIMLCSTKLYNDTNNNYENYLVLYDTVNESTQLITSFFGTSNVDWTSFNSFTRYNDLIYFRFGRKVWKYNITTETVTQVLNVTNLDGFDIVGDFLIYYTPGVAHFRDLNTDQVVTTFGAAYLDAFHLENNSIYFYEADFVSSSNKTYSLVKYNISSNSFQTLFSNSFSTSFSINRTSSSFRLGNNLIYTIHTANGVGSYVSLNITTDTMNSDFTFNINTQFKIPEPFVIGNQVYITTEDDTYVSDGVSQPTLTTLGEFLGRDLVDGGLVYNDEIYRVVDRDDLGPELWKTDGQTMSLVKDIYPGTGGGMSISTSTGIVNNNRIYTIGIFSVIHESDGTDAGTVPVYDNDLFTFAGGLKRDNNSRLYFSGTSPTLGSGLFRLVPETLSITEFDSNSALVNLYLNPLTNTLTFDKLVDDVHIYDMQGKLIVTASDTEMMNVAQLTSNTVYIVKYTYNEKIYTKKLILTSK